MRGAHDLAAEQSGVAFREGETEHEAVAAVPRAQRQPEIHDVELTREMLDGAVVCPRPADAQRRQARLDPELRHHLLGGPHGPGGGHEAEFRPSEGRERRLHAG